jgi:hypothetical protein
MLGLSTSLVKGGMTGRQYVKDGLKLYMPYRGADLTKGTQFVGTGSTSFDGDNDYILCGDDTSLDITDDITMMAWVKPTTAGQNAHIIGRDDGTNRNYVLYVNGNIYSFDYFVSGTGHRVSSTTADTANVWVHLACLRDKTTGKNIIYVNGVAEDTDSDSTTAIDNDDVQFSIGCRAIATSDFTGNIKNVAIWSRALTATEIQNVMYKSYAEVSGRLASGLVSWWALDATEPLATEMTTTATADWSLDTGWSISDGVLTFADTNDNIDASNQGGVAMTATKKYQLTFTIAELTSGTAILTIKDYSGNTLVAQSGYANGTHTVQFTGASSSRLRFNGDTDSTSSFTISEYSLKEISIEDLKGSNDGTPYGVTIDTDLYGGDTPVKPRAIDNAPTVQADAIGVGSALFVASNTDYINVGNSSSLQITGTAITVTSWVNILTDTDWMKIISNSTGGSYTDGYTFFYSNEQFHFSINHETINVAKVAYTDYGEWHHLTGVYDGTNIKIYVDGVLGGTDTYSSAIGNTRDTYIGAGYTDAINGHMNGNIAQVGLWQGALDQAQIQSVMEKTFEELTATEKSSLGAELFADGDMETGNEDDWDDNLDDTEATLSDPYGKVTKSWARSGTQVLSMKRESGSGGLAQNVTGLSTSTLYKYTAYVRTDSGDAVIDNLIYMYLDDDNNLGSGATNLNSSVNGLNTKDTWTKLEAYFVPPNTSTWIGFWIGGDNSIWYVDDMSLKAVTHDLVSYWALDEADGNGVLDKVGGTVGSELVTNGTFDSDASGWTAGGSATLASESGYLKISNEASTNHGTAIQEITTVSGTSYKVTGDIKFSEGDALDLQFKLGTSSGGTQYYNSGDVTADTSVNQYIHSTGTSLFITLQNSGNGGTDGYYDNISVKSVTGNVGILI